MILTGKQAVEIGDLLARLGVGRYAGPTSTVMVPEGVIVLELEEARKLAQDLFEARLEVLGYRTSGDERDGRQ